MVNRRRTLPDSETGEAKDFRDEDGRWESERASLSRHNILISAFGFLCPHKYACVEAGVLEETSRKFPRRTRGAELPCSTGAQTSLMGAAGSEGCTPVRRHAHLFLFFILLATGPFIIGGHRQGRRKSWLCTYRTYGPVPVTHFCWTIHCPRKYCDRCSPF